MKIYAMAVALAALLTGGLPQTNDDFKEGTYWQKKFVGFVPDATTACSIAKVILPKMVGLHVSQDFIYKAELVKKEWKVTVDIRPPKTSGGQSKGELTNNDFAPVLMINRFSGAMSFRPY